MSRYPLPLSTWGTIRTGRVTLTMRRALANYRGLDGKLRNVEARGPSAAAARRDLQVRLRERQTPGHGLVDPTSHVSELAEIFGVDLERSDKASRTKDKYAYCSKKYIIPGMGSLRLGEVTPGVVDHFIRSVVENAGPPTARSCGAVLSGMFKIALRHDAVAINPVLGITIPRIHSANPKALDAEQYRDLRAKLIDWERAPAPGRTRTQELHEISDFLIATGLRPGELFALRWDDIDLQNGPPTAFINATVIRTSTGGVRIQDHPKTRHGIRHVTLPAFLVTSLQIRQARQGRTEESEANPLHLIFPSSTGTVCDPNNIGRAWHKAVEAIGYGWVTLKTFRKANATLITRTMGLRQPRIRRGIPRSR